MNGAGKEPEKENGSRSSEFGGAWIAIGAGVGVALGAGLGSAFNNVGVGVGVGVAIGAGIGSMIMALQAAASNKK